MKVSLSAILKGLTSREVKLQRTTPSQVISYSGLYYNGSDYVSVTGNQSSEFVQKYLPELADKYASVKIAFPSKKDTPDFITTDLADAGMPVGVAVNPD